LLNWLDQRVPVLLSMALAATVPEFSAEDAVAETAVSLFNAQPPAGGVLVVASVTEAGSRDSSPCCTSPEQPLINSVNPTQHTARNDAAKLPMDMSALPISMAHG
jgi:hypothetical protein